MDFSDWHTPAVLGVGTAVPAHRILQTEAALWLAESLADNKDAARWVRRVFPQCGVETRYTCEPSFQEPARCAYLPGAPAQAVPTTAERMRIYEREAPQLMFEAAERALADSGMKAADVTHLIAVSCTGMMLPGLDALLARRFRLAAHTARLPLTYLGCAAGLKAICLARDIVARDPGAVVLIACVELCTLHLQAADTREALFAAALFGDGASACVVGAAGHGGLFALGEYLSVLLPAGGADMTWHIGDAGFDLVLSPSIPALLAEFLPEQIERLLGGDPLPPLWAVHPGGKGIVEAVGRSFALNGAQTEPSLSVLRRYGNMSSATILFVLDELRRTRNASQGAQTVTEPEGVATAFGPGLTAELLRFRQLGQGAIGGRSEARGVYAG